jgi:hypothetical protein
MRDRDSVSVLMDERSVFLTPVAERISARRHPLGALTAVRGGSLSSCGKTREPAHPTFEADVSPLGLGRLDAVCETADPKVPCPNAELNKADDYIKAAEPSPTMTTWVAFNDVNDLLGYELPGHLPEAGSTGALINVTVRNPGFRFLRSLKDPNAAHTRQADNPAIIEAIVEGFAVPRIGPAQPLSR